MLTYSPAAYIVVFSVDDKFSLEVAEIILAYLTNCGVLEQSPVILVANKTDLVRSRIVKTKGSLVENKYEVIIAGAQVHFFLFLHV